MPSWRERGTMIKPTSACIAGVKVRITRQRTVGKIARPSGADIAAGVTPGRPWHFTLRTVGTEWPFRSTDGASATISAVCVHQLRVRRNEFPVAAISRSVGYQLQKISPDESVSAVGSVKFAGAGNPCRSRLVIYSRRSRPNNFCSRSEARSCQSSLTR